MIKIDVLVKEKSWKKYISNPKKYLNNKVRLLNNSIPLLKKINSSFSILLTGNKEIKELNIKFRKKNKTTDVLSFPFYSKQEVKNNIKKLKKIYLGDIAINFYKIKKEKKNEFENEFNKLWIHGFLHLLGYKHYINRDFKKMHKFENQLFKKIKKN